MPDHEKEKEKEREKEKSGAPVVAEPSLTSPANPAQHKVAPPTEEEAASAFFAAPLPGFDASEISGTLIVIEGMDGSGRSTQISLLKEWLEWEGFAVRTSRRRRSKPRGAHM